MKKNISNAVFGALTSFGAAASAVGGNRLDAYALSHRSDRHFCKLRNGNVEHEEYSEIVWDAEENRLRTVDGQSINKEGNILKIFMHDCTRYTGTPK